MLPLIKFMNEKDSVSVIYPIMVISQEQVYKPHDFSCNSYQMIIIYCNTSFYPLYHFIFEVPWYCHKQSS